MHIDVNPRYGKWDDSQVVLGGTKEPWVKDVTGAGQQRT